MARASAAWPGAGAAPTTTTFLHHHHSSCDGCAPPCVCVPVLPRAESYPEHKVVSIGAFRIGLMHGHQVAPVGETEALAAVQRSLDVDVLVTGHTHASSILEYDGKAFVNPGSITGAYSPSGGLGEVKPSFMLMNITEARIEFFLYELLPGERRAGEREGGRLDGWTGSVSAGSCGDSAGLRARQVLHTSVAPPLCGMPSCCAVLRNTTTAATVIMFPTTTTTTIMIIMIVIAGDKLKISRSMFSKGGAAAAGAAGASAGGGKHGAAATGSAE